MFMETMTHQSSPLLFLQLLFGHHGLYAAGLGPSREILQFYAEMGDSFTLPIPRLIYHPSFVIRLMLHNMLLLTINVRAL